MSSDLIFYVNGKKVTEQNPSPLTTLADYLRYTLKLTGTKVACGEAGCGSCTVMISCFDRSTSKISHYTVNSCITSICALHGLAVTTIEALGSTRTKLHALQERLVASHGIQCGFCTPGMLMSMYALLRNNGTPSELQIEHALKGNLCRCTGYRPILDAFRSFSKGSACPMGEKCCKNKSDQNKCDKTQCEKADSCYGCTIEGQNSGRQELIFPNELQLSDALEKQNLKFTSGEVTWFRPATLNELLTLKKQHPEAYLYAGGTAIAFDLKTVSAEKPVVVIAANKMHELHHIEEKPDGICFGAMTTITALEQKLAAVTEKLPETSARIYAALLDATHCFASPQVRNRATIGGSLANAHTLADFNVLLLATGSRIKMASAGILPIKPFPISDREVNVQEFFNGASGTCLKPNEAILGVFIPHSKKNEYYEMYKQGPRKDFNLAIVNAGMHVEFEENDAVVKKAVFAFGGLTSKLEVAHETAKMLVGRKWEGSLIDDLMPSVTKELGKLLTDGEEDKFKLSLAQGFMFKFFLKVYYKHFNKMDVLKLLGEEEKHLFSNQAAQDRTHSGMQIYDIVTKQSEADSVGQPLPHRWAKQSSTGEAVFVDDMKPTHGEVFMALVLSTKASAKILKIDASKALAMKGVIDFVDHTTPVSNFTGAHGPEEEIFASKEVYFVGQTIGAIVADSYDHARRAAHAVVIEYEELEPIITFEDAIAKKSFHHFHFGNGLIRYGDAAAALASSDHVIEGEFRMGSQEHFYLETQSVRVVPKGEDGEMDVYIGAQNSTGVQLVISSACSIACNKIVVHTKRIGGAFGGKEFRMFISALPAAIAAHKLNRPTRLVLERVQDMQMTGYRRPYLAKYKVGFNKDGKIQALDLDMYSNDGYHVEFADFMMGQSLVYCNNCYNIPNISARGHLCKTNLPPTSSMRGAGVPQGVFICEYWMAKVAEFLNMAPDKLRELNMYQAGDVSFVNVPIEASLRRCYDEVLKQSDYENAKKKIEEFNRQSTVLKKGIAVIPLKFSPSMPPGFIKAGALVNIYLDGSVLVYHGGVESGQGLHTKMMQVASRALDLPIEKIHISETSSGVVPNSMVTGGSCTADFNGPAILDACNQLLERLKPVKEANPTGKWEDWITAAYNQRIQLSATGFHNRAYNEDYNWETGKGRIHGYYTYGAAVTQLEIDCLTGNYVILKVDIVMDIGKSLNPAIDVGQIEGAFVMGTGLCALEEHCFGPDGHLKTVGPEKYKIPTINSIPLEMNVSLLKESGNPMAIYSSKGIGEPPLLLSFSVYFALLNAICAARRQAGLDNNYVLNTPANCRRIRLACGTEPQKLIQSAKK